MKYVFSLSALSESNIQGDQEGKALQRTSRYYIEVITVQNILVK